MAFEEEKEVESLKGAQKFSSKSMTLEQAVSMGEYDPAFLATYPEWHTFSRHVQFQYIRQALDNRWKHLIVQWSEINNMLDFRLKPHLKEALKNIEKQIKNLETDREKLHLEYSR